jgi:hypothetical protein
MRISPLLFSAPTLALALGVTSLCLPCDAQAQSQMYRCRDAFGAATVSDRPCASARMGSVGPAPSPRGYSADSLPSSSTRAYSPQDYRLPDHYAYLSPRCQQLQDAMRTARTRGLNHMTQGELQVEWQRQCSENEIDARRQARDVRQTKDRQRQEAVATEHRERADAQRQREQCAELRGALAKRKSREALMSEGERGDLRRFESNYQERCLAA